MKGNPSKKETMADIDSWYSSKKHQAQAKQHKQHVMKNQINSTLYYFTYAEKFGTIHWSGCVIVLFQDEKLNYFLGYARQTTGFPFIKQTPILKIQLPIQNINNIFTAKNKLILMINQSQKWEFRFFDNQKMLTKWTQLLISLKCQQHPKKSIQHFIIEGMCATNAAHKKQQQLKLKKSQKIPIQIAKVLERDHKNEKNNLAEKVIYQEHPLPISKNSEQSKLPSDPYLENALLKQALRKCEKALAEKTNQYQNIREKEEIFNQLIVQKNDLTQIVIQAKQQSNQAKQKYRQAEQKYRQVEQKYRKAEQKSDSLFKRILVLQDAQKKAQIKIEENQALKQIITLQRKGLNQSNVKTSKQNNFGQIMQERNKLQQQVKRLTYQTSELKSRAEKCQKENIELKSQVGGKSSNEKIALLEGEKIKLQQQLKRHQDEYKRLQNQKQKLVKENAQLKQLQKTKEDELKKQQSLIQSIKQQFQTAKQKIVQESLKCNELKGQNQRLQNVLKVIEKINIQHQSQKGKMVEKINLLQQNVKTAGETIGKTQLLLQKRQQQYQILRRQVDVLADKNLKIQSQMRILQSQSQQMKNKYQIQIDDLNATIQRMRKEIKSLKNQMNQVEKLRETLEKKEQEITTLQQTVHQSVFNSLFQGEMLSDKPQHKSFLKKSIENMRKKTIIKTSKIFTYDPLNQTPFHKYIDDIPDIAVIIKTEHLYYLAGFSESPISSTNIANKDGIIVALTKQKVFPLMQGKRSVTYDQFFLIFGNSEIRLRQGEWTVFCNVGIANSFYNTMGGTVVDLIGENHKGKEVKISGFEVHRVFYG